MASPEKSSFSQKRPGRGAERAARLFRERFLCYKGAMLLIF